MLDLQQARALLRAAREELRQLARRCEAPRARRDDGAAEAVPA